MLEVCILNPPLTILLYNATKVGIDICLKLRLIKPNIIYAFFIFLCMWSLKYNLHQNIHQCL